MATKVIEIHLLDGTPNGILTAKILGNWTGIVTVASRAHLAELAKRSDVKKTGVYALIGQDPDNPLRDRVYIGEGDNVLTRLYEHDNKKDFWTRCLVITDTSDTLTKAHVRYLESRMIQIAAEAKRAKMVNDKTPSKPPLPESHVAVMEAYLEEIIALLPVLGFSFALPVPTITAKPRPIDSMQAIPPILRLNRSGVIAEAQVINGECIVLKGSTVRKREGASLSRLARERRSLIRSEGILSDSPDGSFWVLNENVPFSSPSQAAAVLVGYTINGSYEWKVKDTGQPYREWQQAQLAQASIIAPPISK